MGKGGREHQPLGEEGGLKKLNGRKKTKHEKEKRREKTRAGGVGTLNHILQKKGAE